MASILSLASVLGADVDQQINWFQVKGLMIARNKTCPACSHGMNMQSRSDISDKYIQVHSYIRVSSIIVR